jgi:hypothetical protein
MDTTRQIIVGLAVAIIVALAGWIWTNYTGNKTTIISPKAGESVLWTAPLEGTYSNELKDKDLWIVVQPVKSPQYHPQTSKITKQANHKWSTVVYIGESESKNIGEEFILHLVSADTTASSLFQTYLTQAASMNWHGMASLPSSSSVAVSIRVLRK